jgi:hypothetical protein
MPAGKTTKREDDLWHYSMTADLGLGFLLANLFSIMSVHSGIYKNLLWLEQMQIFYYWWQQSDRPGVAPQSMIYSSQFFFQSLLRLLFAAWSLGQGKFITNFQEVLSPYTHTHTHTHTHTCLKETVNNTSISFNIICKILSILTSILHKQRHMVKGISPLHNHIWFSSKHLWLPPIPLILLFMSESFFFLSSPFPTSASQTYLSFESRDLCVCTYIRVWFTGPCISEFIISTA